MSTHDDTVAIAARLGRAEREELDSIAVTTDRTRSQLIRLAVREYLARARVAEKQQP